MANRKCPPHPIRVAGRQARTTTAPAFGKVPTFSHRLPPPRKPRTSSLPPSATDKQAYEMSDEELSDSSDVDGRLEAIAAAQVSSRAVARLRARPTPLVAVDVHPATPTPKAPAAVEPAADQAPIRLADPSTLRTLKQSRRTASIYSVSSSGAVVGMGVSAQGQQRHQVYLRPDLSGHSGLSLDQVSRTATCDALTEDLAVVSATAHQPVDVVPDAVVVQMHHLASSSSLGPPPSCDYPSASSAHPAPPLIPLHTTTSYALPPSYPSVAVPRTAQRRETPSERLKRLYLCPWEAISPRSARRAPVNSPVVGEKTLPLDKVVVGAREDAAGLSPTSRRLVVAAGVILTVVLLVDLVVLNIRVFSMRDAYYDE
ncbi:hypothetical protein DMC30DRAFT_11385 [Rhodotorula diobovata]|uniref:Uncharacterized protein n=1 Tax=Rhodotorula diobovata TaxID=5288 RepID=A0A5C5G5C7_9BASI|nr:hypothetical protein DMC30DRAFT_11385 [Rhodotorula diobovata]